MQNKPKPVKQKKMPSKEDKTSFDGTFEELIDIIAPRIKQKQKTVKDAPIKL